MNQSINSHDKNVWLHLLFLLGWLVIGMALRFANLDAKPAASIEIATLGFSLGHGFSQIPLDKVIDISTLLAPLRFDRTIAASEVVHRLMTESTHPPIYFWLTHWWAKLFLSNGELVSLKIGRSLSAVFGALAIPAIFGLSWVAFRSRLIAHLAAALMAFSPYGIYLAQEARHYTLTILWIIASLTCLMVATQCINRRDRLPIWLGCIWVLVNSLGIATHYFFSLAFGAEALAIVGLWIWDFNRKDRQFSFSSWWRIGAVGLGTLVGCLIWLPVASGISSNELTDWIKTSYDLDQIGQPLPRLMAWLITMVIMLPIEGTSTAVTVISALVVLLALIWLIPALIRGWQSSLHSELRLPLKVLIGYGLGAIIIYLLVIYGLGKDVSLAARYHFVYFPVVLVLVAVALANLWQATQASAFKRIKSHWFYAEGKRVVIIMLLMGFLGSLTVISDLGFQKSLHSDSLAAHIQAKTTVPTIVAMTYETHSQLRELIALALSFERVSSQTKSLSLKSNTSEFILVRQTEDRSFATLNNVLTSQPKPLDLWGINLKVDPENLNQLNCIEDRESRLSNSGYMNRLYHCR